MKLIKKKKKNFKEIKILWVIEILHEFLFGMRDKK